MGGTRFMGKHLIKSLITRGYTVTIATRGITSDGFKDSVNRVLINRTDADSIKNILSGTFYDVVFDSLAYCSNDVKYVLDSINCKKYVTISTTAVYDKHIDTKEYEFNPLKKPLVWCNRTDFPYDEIKRQVECAIYQEYPHIHSVSVRFPFAIGPDDYTKRLYFYIDHIINQKPMFIDYYDNQMAFVRSDEAGKFLAVFAENNFCGAINGASEQTISLKD
ncbi:MAG: NAD-dependent epimerase/dehydratase family protein, partial [Lentimicrobiaceae bacterium]|nr:NAD-dependent epimerase/dehydratase family protein [Lentimicrobiaceae bacterium]